MTDDDLKYWTPGDMKAYLVRGLNERLRTTLDKTRAIKAMREFTDQLAAGEQTIHGAEITKIEHLPDGREIVHLRVPAWWLGQLVEAG